MEDGQNGIEMKKDSVYLFIYVKDKDYVYLYAKSTTQTFKTA